jgi:WD40 repeat protein
MAQPDAGWAPCQNAILALGWADGDRALLAASADKTISEWDAETRRRVATLRGHTYTRAVESLSLTSVSLIWRTHIGSGNETAE